MCVCMYIQSPSFHDDKSHLKYYRFLHLIPFALNNKSTYWAGYQPGKCDTVYVSLLHVFEYVKTMLLVMEVWSAIKIITLCEVKS